MKLICSYSKKSNVSNHYLMNEVNLYKDDILVRLGLEFSTKRKVLSDNNSLVVESFEGFPITCLDENEREISHMTESWLFKYFEQMSVTSITFCNDYDFEILDTSKVISDINIIVVRGKSERVNNCTGASLEDAYDC